MEFLYKEGGIILHQTKYATYLLKRFNMLNCNIVVTPIESGLKLKEDNDEEMIDASLYKQIIGSLSYLCNNQLDTNFVVGVLSRFMHDPRKSHLLTGKRVLRYIKGTWKKKKQISDRIF